MFLKLREDFELAFANQRQENGTGGLGALGDFDVLGKGIVLSEARVAWFWRM